MRPSQFGTIATVVNCDGNQRAAKLVRECHLRPNIDWVGLECPRRNDEIILCQVRVDCQLDCGLVNVGEGSPAVTGSIERVERITVDSWCDSRCQ